MLGIEYRKPERESRGIARIRRARQIIPPVVFFDQDTPQILGMRDRRAEYEGLYRLAVLGEVIKIDPSDKLIARRHICRPPELIGLEVGLQVRDRNQVYSTHTVL